MYEVYTDGAVSGNGKADAPGGWAYVIIKDGSMIACDSGGELGTTNQRMELTAALKACQAVEAMDPFATVKLYSDSAYFVRCFKENWWKNWRANGWKNSKKEPVANQDLWDKLIFFFMKAPGYDFVKVRGHAGNLYNEMVDKMAVRAKEEIMYG
jgi:ribonuclease HI